MILKFGRDNPDENRRRHLAQGLYLVGAVLIGLPVYFVISIFFVKAARSS